MDGSLGTLTEREGESLGGYRRLIESSIHEIFSTTASLYMRDDVAYLDLLQILSAFSPDSLNSLEVDSIRANLKLLGIQSGTYTGIAKSCVDDTSPSNLEQDLVCSTVAYLISAFWQNVSSQVTSQSSELRLLTGHVDGMRPLYMHPNQSVRSAVASALGEMGRSIPETDTVIEALLFDESSQVRDRALEAIVKTGSVNVLSRLEKDLLDESSDDVTRLNAVIAIGRISQFASDSLFELREVLLSNSLDDVSRQRIIDEIELAKSVALSSDVGNSMRQEIVLKLIDLTSTEHSLKVRQEAIFSLAHVSSDDDLAVLKVLRETLSSSEEFTDLRVVAAYALGEIGNSDDEVFDSLKKAIDSNETPKVQASAAYSISQLWSGADPRVVHSTTQALNSLADANGLDERGRAMALYALGELAASITASPDGELNPVNLEILLDTISQKILLVFDEEKPSTNLQTVATVSMCGLHEWSSDLINRLIMATKDEDATLRRNAVIVLGFLPERIKSNLRKDVILSLVYVLANEQEYPSIRLESSKSLLGKEQGDSCGLNHYSSGIREGLLKMSLGEDIDPLNETIVALRQLQKLSSTLRAPNYFAGHRGSNSPFNIGIFQTRSTSELLESLGQISSTLRRILEIIRDADPQLDTQLELYRQIRDGQQDQQSFVCATRELLPDKFKCEQTSTVAESAPPQQERNSR